jgi:hypothetical protein
LFDQLSAIMTGLHRVMRAMTVASPTDGRVDQRSVICAGLLVMLTTGSHQLIGS